MALQKFIKGCALVFFTTVSVITPGINTAFADSNSCANPTELKLAEGVMMKFCDIPGFYSEYGSNKVGFSMSELNLQMAQYEVTQLQYKTIMGKTPWLDDKSQLAPTGIGDTYPADNISYSEAEEFAERINKLDSSALYRLPTKPEFTYATRAHTSTKYYWGDEARPENAYYWSRGNSLYKSNISYPVDSCPSAEMSKQKPGYCANSYGLYHMLGNVWEWFIPLFDYVSQTELPNAFSFQYKTLPFIGGGWTEDSDGLDLNKVMVVHNGNGVNGTGFRLVRISRAAHH